MTLDQLPPLRRAEIVAIDWSALSPEEAKRLRALGVDEGEPLEGMVAFDRPVHVNAASRAGVAEDQGA